MNLLHVDSSILGDHSVSRQVSAAAVAALRAQHPDLTVTYRDVAADPPPHLSGALLASLFHEGTVAAFPPVLLHTTVRAATAYASGSLGGALVRPKAAALAKAVLQ